MEPDYKWIAQDADGAIWSFSTKPEPQWAFNAFYAASDVNNKRAEIGNPNPNWRDSLIDLEKEDYEIIDGILTRKPKAKVYKSELTDTELLDAIMWHKLIVDRMDNGKVIIWKSGGGGVDAINKKGNIRKAIKKWLRKNVDTKPVEDEKTYNLQIHDGTITEVFSFQDKSEFKEYVESL